MPLPPISSGSGGIQPGIPTIGTATAGDASASITFTAPSYLGKPTGTTYTATSTPSSITGTSSTSPITVSGLSNGTAYTFKVKLGNGVATSLESASSNSATPAASPAPFGFTPFAPFGFTPFSFTPFGFTPFGPSYSEYSVARNTGVLTVDGRKPASELQVGDKLYGMNIPSENVLDWTSWQSSDIVLNSDNVVETEIVSINLHQTDKIYSINGDLYSGSHYVLTKKDDIVKFTRADEIDSTYFVYSYAAFDFEAIISVEAIDYEETVYSINCEPYDNFFTDNMLVFDSKDKTNN
jgi:hypothetical protein